MSGWSGVVQVSSPRATFGLVVTNGIVTEAAPYGRSASLGKPITRVATYWRSRGWTVEPVAPST
jgi:hypothetical protein